ncbi:MAG: ABC transporter permease [Chloroflexi bacterium]|nr:ABC transporter permease [Chloroflexota bacterium]
MSMKIASPARLTAWAGRNTAMVALLIVFLIGSLFVENFLTGLNLSAILYQYAIIGFLALGQLLVILTAGIDLSQGSLVALTSIVTAYMMRSFGITVAVISGLIASALLGFATGFIVSRTRIPAFVVTLGSLGIARGLALLIADAKPISIEIESFVDFGRANLLGIPVSAILWILLGVGLAFFLKNRRIGRHIYAVGGGEESARLSGVDVKNVKLLVYGLSGLLTAIGGIIWTARLSSGSPIGGTNYEMESIAAVMVGGGSLFGGVGSVSGTVVGVLLFGVINSILNLVGISPYWQGTIKGVLILAAVALSQIRRVHTTH